MKEKTYLVTGNLIAGSATGPEINYKGCTATIFHELPQSYAVVFYAGTPVLIPKKDFMESTKEIEPEELPVYVPVNVTLSLNSLHVQRFRTIVFHNEDTEEKVKSTALRVFKLKYGVNYNTIKYEFTNLKSEPTMTKQTEKTEATENATPAEAGVSLFEEQATKVSLPAIPTAFTLGGIEVSIDSINKKVEEVKKLKLADQTDKKTYDLIKKKATELQKTRTATQKFRTAVAKPINAWLKTLKTNVEDNIAAAVKPGEDHCAEQMKIYEDWEAKQERLENERIEKLVQSRRELLQAIGGEMNVASFSWYFKYSGVLIENEELATWSDEEFTEVYNDLERNYKAYQEAELKKQQEAQEAKGLVVATRKQMLQLMQYTENNGVYSKNGWTLSEAEIANSDEAAWMQLMMQHNTPKPTPASPFAVPSNPTAATEAAAQPSTSAPSGFSPFAVAMSQPEPAAQEAQSAPVEVDTPELVQFTQEDALNLLFPENKYYFDFPLKQTTVRVFPTGAKEQASDGVQIAYAGDYPNGISFIIFKHV